MLPHMKLRGPHDADDLIKAAKLLAVASAWHELGLFERLAAHEGPMALSDLPGDPRALRITATVLAHARLLDGHGERFALSPTGRALLEQGAMPTGRNLEWMADLGRMAGVIRDGGPVKDERGDPKVTRGGVRPDDPEASRAFLDGLYQRSAISAHEVAGWVQPYLPAGGHVLDVGGGHGRYSEAFVQLGFSATLFDMPMVVGFAEERYGERLSYRAGDYHQDDFGGPYDAAFLSNIVHGESFEANADLMRRLAAALRPGGWVVIKDMFVDEQGRDPDSAVFFGTTMLFYTAEGRSYALDDARAWADRAGLELVETISAESYSILLIRRPE